MEQNLVMISLVVYEKRCGKCLIITLSLINLKTEILMVNYELIGIGEFYSLFKSMTKCKSKSMTMTKSKSKCKSLSKSKSMTKSNSMSK